MQSEADMRFSDEQLTRLREDFNAHKEEQDARWGQALQLIEANNQTTAELAKTVQSLAESTQGIVQLYADVKGAARVGTAVQGFLFWVAKWGTLGGLLYAAADSLIDHFTRGGPP